VLSRLRHLSLLLNRLGARGARVVLQSPNLAGLWTLDLSHNDFKDGTARMVASTTPLGQLRRLNLGNDRGLTEAGLRALAASPRLPHLLQLERGGHLWEREGDVSRVLIEQGKGAEL
jgi:hypothetical protein